MGALAIVPPYLDLVLVPAFAVWLPLLRRRVALGWVLFALAAILILRGVVRFWSLGASDSYLALERAGLLFTLSPWLVALSFWVWFRVVGARAGPGTTGERTAVVLAVFAPLLLIVGALLVSSLTIVL